MCETCRDKNISKNEILMTTVVEVKKERAVERATARNSWQKFNGKCK